MAKKNPTLETLKFVTRTAVLVGVPAVLAELAVQKPQWGFWLGLVGMIVDKYIHNSPVKAKGLLPW